MGGRYQRKIATKMRHKASTWARHGRRWLGGIVMMIRRSEAARARRKAALAEPMYESVRDAFEAARKDSR